MQTDATHARVDRRCHATGEQARHVVAIVGAARDRHGGDVDRAPADLIFQVIGGGLLD
ncbi:hypothetical protein [Caldilinea sp.]|uniref:hypothetical protein n=1 Tax=Caldilinea sp. TaxID=2293560 RepID=UPI002BE967CF|nr:hypothetical protein [Anaerolineales bacterium]HQY91093.1 hypothetical protein [Caldilinea sp.]HRA64841.1 hypothetical protein [Caldilinea sp.]